MPKNRKVVVCVSDFHSGHILGLMNPSTELDVEGLKQKPNSTASQEYLWELYSDAIGKIKEISGKDDLYILYLGDVTHGEKYKSELVTTRLADQVQIAIDNFEPWLQLRNLKAIRFAKGTAAHSFGEGSSEILISSALVSKNKKISASATFHGVVSIDGYRIDFAHHGPTPGSRYWLGGDEARRYMKSLMMGELVNGNTPPDLVLRGHYHTYIKEIVSMNGKSSTIMILPSMCMMSEYAHQATRSMSRVVNGLVALEIIDGQISKTHEFIKVLDIRTTEVL